MPALATRTLRSLRRYKKGLLPSRQVRIGRYTIVTTPNHPLPEYLRRFPLYDQFIPRLCRSLQGTVIDIGANIGDTMAAILDSNPELQMICVEPDDQFFTILQRNRAAIDQHHRVRTFKAFVTRDGGNFTIVKNERHSTGHLQQVSQADAAAGSVTFGQLLAEFDVASPALVKSDTDGFDAPILASIAEHAQGHAACRPILFFEMQTYLQDQGFADPGRSARQADYLKAIEQLRDLGYRHFAALDNFGTPMLHSSDFNALHALQDYIQCSQLQNRHSPIFFLDVVLCQDQHLPVVSDTLASLQAAPTRERN